MLVMLVERVIKVTINPSGAGNHTEEDGLLREIIRVVVIASSDRVQFLVQIGVNDFVSEVVMGLLPEVFRVV